MARPREREKRPKPSTIAKRLNMHNLRYYDYNATLHLGLNPLEKGLDAEKIIRRANKLIRMDPWNHIDHELGYHQHTQFRMEITKRPELFEGMDDKPFVELIDPFMESWCRNWIRDEFFAKHSDMLKFNIREYMKNKDLRMCKW